MRNEEHGGSEGTVGSETVTNRRVKITKVVKKIINDRYLFLAMLSPTRWVGEETTGDCRRTTNEREARERCFRYTYQIERELT